MTRTPNPNANRWTSVALIAVGLLMIFLGWNGAAGADAAVDLRAQFPYLISGGVFGLALVGAGLALVRTNESRKDSQAILRQLEALTAAVEALAAARTYVDPLPPAPATPPVPVGGQFERGF